MTAFLLSWPSLSLADLGDPRPRRQGSRPDVSEQLRTIEAGVAQALGSLIRSAPIDGQVDQRWYWAAPLFLDQQADPSVTELLLAPKAASHWEGNAPGEGFLAHLAEARSMADFGPSALGRPPGDLAEVLAEVALGGPAQCAMRAISAVTGLPLAHASTVSNAAWIAAAFRSFFNAPEVTGIVAGARLPEAESEEGAGRYWRDVVRHAIDGSLQAVLDEHAHVLRDWLGHLSLDDEQKRIDAAEDIARVVAEALEVRTSSFRGDIPATIPTAGTSRWRNIG